MFLTHSTSLTKIAPPFNELQPYDIRCVFLSAPRVLTYRLVEFRAEKHIQDGFLDEGLFGERRMEVLEENGIAYEKR